MVRHHREEGVGFQWVGFDGFYGEDPAFLRALDADGEIFVGDVHKDQRIYLKNPHPHVPPPSSSRGRNPSRLKAQTPAMRVDQWAQRPMSTT